MPGKRLTPTVLPKDHVLETDEDVGTDKVGQALPPITHIKPPAMKHLSTKIRWYLGLGYTVTEVKDLLGVRYQQVRNVGTVEPKRAAREDVPPLIVEVWEVDDDLEAMDKHALEQEMAAQRSQDREARRNRNGGHPVEEDDDND